MSARFERNRTGTAQI